MLESFSYTRIERALIHAIFFLALAIQAFIFFPLSWGISIGVLALLALFKRFFSSIVMIHPMQIREPKELKQTMSGSCSDNSSDSCCC